ncbi:rhodanese-like domain-containing protein [Roseovarius sp.]|uniref:rhodanese-like domain-containing protein n=1 Tax=Roseovarius sp. TaxID=1486281 RepID=UPI003D12928E
MDAISKDEMMPGTPKRTMSRRTVIGAGLITAVAAGVGYRVASHQRFDGSELSVRDALEAAQAGDVFLVDIRTPEEWRQTGIGQGAHPIDMRRSDFIAALDSVTGARKDAPIALICARGVRSARLGRALVNAGYTNIVNVPEGMLGSRAGPGWIASGLPVTSYDG